MNTLKEEYYKMYSNALSLGLKEKTAALLGRLYIENLTENLLFCKIKVVRIK